MAGRRRKGGLSFYYKEKKITNEKIKNVLGYLFWVFLAVLIAYVFVYSVGIRTSMIGTSMEPSLYNGQEIMINRIIYNFVKPSHGDVIVFRPNGNEGSHLYVKRVIGVPGDVIRISSGVLYLNDEPQPDMFIDKIADAGLAAEALEIPEDSYFVMGDNCNNSEDSRSANLGFVNIDTVYGKAWFHLAAQKEGLGFIK